MGKNKVKTVIIAVLIFACVFTNLVRDMKDSELAEKIVFYDISSSDNEIKNNNAEANEIDKERIDISENTGMVIEADRKTDNDVNSRININKADLDELDLLYRIGPALAQRIIDYRNDYGEFSCIEEIKEVKGIGDSIYNQIKDKITVE